MNLPLLSIEAAEELQRLNKKLATNLENVKVLSELIKKDFPERMDYSLIFSEAYLLTYSKQNFKLSEKNLKEHMTAIFKRLESPSSLKNEELEKLIYFCVNLSDYSGLYEKYIGNLRLEGCFS